MKNTFEELQRLVLMMKEQYEKEIESLKKKKAVDELEYDFLEIDDPGIGKIEYFIPRNILHQQIMESLERLILKKGALYVSNRLCKSVQELGA